MCQCLASVKVMERCEAAGFTAKEFGVKSSGAAAAEAHVETKAEQEEEA